MNFYSIDCQAEKKNVAFKKCPYIGAFTVEVIANSEDEALEAAKKAMARYNKVSGFKIYYSREVVDGVLLIRSLWDE